MTDKQAYVDQHWEYAQNAGKRFGIDPIIILSQAALESAWGTSNLSKNYHNYFGITAAGAANEFWKGKVYQATNQYKLKFRVYASPQDCFNDFARLITSKYKSAASVAHDYKLYAKAIANSPYISESNGDNRENYKNNIINFYGQILSLAKKKGYLLPPPLV